VEAKMAAYFIVDIDVHDPAGMREYLETVPAALTKYGGRYIVRGGKFEVVEGNWQPTRVVMMEFPTMEQAKKWYDCEEYKNMKAARQASARTDIVLVEGV
jgi:uncharacterized protein (DUF1330 family)